MCVFKWWSASAAEVGRLHQLMQHPRGMPASKGACISICDTQKEYTCVRWQVGKLIDNCMTTLTTTAKIVCDEAQSFALKLTKMEFVRPEEALQVCVLVACLRFCCISCTLLLPHVAWILLAYMKHFLIGMRCSTTGAGVQTLAVGGFTRH
jgi:hypothetical protein